MSNPRETHGFQAEVRQLMQLMIHSLYSHREIFLRELISNASDACDKLRFEAIGNPELTKDGTELRIEIEVDRDAKTLTVRDHGIGMTRGHLRLIFNRFYRIGREVRRSHTGTGLGLFIVKSVVKGHRGTVTADSPGPDKGSTFTVTLPGVLEGVTADQDAEVPQGVTEVHG